MVQCGAVFERENGVDGFRVCLAVTWEGKRQHRLTHFSFLPSSGIFPPLPTLRFLRFRHAAPRALFRLAGQISRPLNRPRKGDRLSARPARHDTLRRVASRRRAAPRRTVRPVACASDATRAVTTDGCKLRR